MGDRGADVLFPERPERVRNGARQGVAWHGISIDFGTDGFADRCLGLRSRNNHLLSTSTLPFIPLRISSHLSRRRAISPILRVTTSLPNLPPPQYDHRLVL